MSQVYIKVSVVYIWWSHDIFDIKITRTVLHTYVTVSGPFHSHFHPGLPKAITKIVWIVFLVWNFIFLSSHLLQFAKMNGGEILLTVG